VAHPSGPHTLSPGGAIARKRLGHLVFTEPEKRLLLNSLVHPDIRTEIVRRIVALEGDGRPGIVMVDAALMVESGSHELYDKLVVVHCEPQLQIARLVARDGLTPEEAGRRMAAQLPVAEKLKLADYQIDTSGTFRETRDQVEEVYRRLVLDEIRLREGSEG
jgi:dephospho-CoA kinase